MRLLKRFVAMFFQSITDPAYYTHILFSRFRSSVLFFLGVCAIISLFTLAYWRTVQFPRIYRLIQSEVKTAFDTLPDTFLVRFRDNVLSIEGVPLPLRIPASKKIQAEGVAPLLLSYEDPGKDRAFIRLAQNQMTLLLPTSTGMAPRDIPYSEFDLDDFSFTKSQLSGHIQSQLAILPDALTILCIIGIPFYFAFFTISLLISLLLISLLTHSLIWFLGIRMRYIKMLQLNLHAGAVSACVEELHKILYPHSSLSLFWPSLFAILLLVLWQLGKKRYNT